MCVEVFAAIRSRMCVEVFAVVRVEAVGTRVVLVVNPLCRELRGGEPLERAS